MLLKKNQLHSSVLPKAEKSENTAQVIYLFCSAVNFRRLNSDGEKKKSQRPIFGKLTIIRLQELREFRKLLPQYNLILHVCKQ